MHIVMDILKSYRSRLNLTQQELAERVGVEPNTYARWERGEETPPDMAIRLIAILAEKDGVASPLGGSTAISKDPHHTAILEGLNRHIDSDVFELCATDLLKPIFPGIAPISGGSDMGFDGAIPTQTGEPFPLIATTATDAKRNLKKNLQQLKKRPRTPESAVFATSRRLRPKTRLALFDLAAELGFFLRGVYDQDWFASALYRDAKWTQRLLGITGRPSALGVVPLSGRPLIGKAVIGRDGELARLRKLTDDLLIIGAPGSGKTFLLRALVNEGLALFLADDNRDALASAVRTQRPAAVIVDDAHAYPEHLESLLWVRQQASADFRVIAVSWPADEHKVRSKLLIKEENIIRLDRLPADTIVEIIENAGIPGPRELLYTIQQHSAGQPGLAVTLAYLCITDGPKMLERVYTGEAVLDSLLPQLNTLIGDDMMHVLGAFALGGEGGYQPDQVARFLGRSESELRQRLAGLEAAGIIRDGQDGSIAICPQSLAPALLHRAFFGGVASLSGYEGLFRSAPSLSDALEVLIGAHARGAYIPELERLLEANASPEQLGSYASIGSGEARYVLEQYPDRIVGTAFGVLEHLPDRAIPLLLSHACSDAPRRDLSRKEQEDYNAQLAYLNLKKKGTRGNSLFRGFGDNSALSLRKIEGWLDRLVPGEQEFGTRRRIAIQSIKSWAESVDLKEPRVAAVASRALMLAFRSMWHGGERDPGAGRRLTVQDCPVDKETTRFLFQEWPNVAELICTATERSQRWPDLFKLQDEWRHELRRVHVLGVSDELWTLRREFADMILQTIATRTQDHPGIQNRVTGVASQEGVIIRTRTDSHFDALYPYEKHLPWDEIEALTKKTVPPLAKEYLAAGAKRSAAQLKHIEAEAHLASLEWPRLTPALCQELAKAVDDPLAWATALLDAGCSADLVGPFAEKTQGRNRRRTIRLLKDYAGDSQYQQLFVRIVLTTQDVAKSLVDTALSMAAAWPQLLQGLAWCDEVPPTTLKLLLTCRYPNVACTAAIGIWNSKEPEQVIRTLEQNWEQAIIAGLCDSQTDDTIGHWIENILATHSDFAEKCLGALLRTANDTALSHTALRVARKATKGLTSQQRCRLIDFANGESFSTGHMIAVLVDDDPDAYAHLLRVGRLQTFHLEPLRSLPHVHWAEFVALAADAGYTTNQIIEVWGPLSGGGSGPVSAMHRSRQKAYEQFIDHTDGRVAEVARRLSDEMRIRAEHEERREREEKIWGI